MLLHHAPYSSSARHGSNSDLQWPYASWGADAVIAGHDHVYERIFQEGIVYFVNGLDGRGPHPFDSAIPGSQLRFNSDHGAMLIDASDTEITFRFLTRTGVEIDRYSIGSSLTAPTPTPISTATNTIEIRIDRGDDDVEEDVSNGSMNFTSSDLELVNELNESIKTQLIGLRFNNLQIPQGASISAAYLEFEVDEIDNSSTSLILRAQAIDDAPAFRASNYNLSKRALTSAATNWSVPKWDAMDVKHRTPDLSTVIEEVISRPGWRIGNSLVIVISGSGRRVAESYNGEATAASLLHVGFSLAPVVANDLIAENLEVTQAIQDLNHRVRLVQDKRTFVRFYARTDQGILPSSIGASEKESIDNSIAHEWRE
ncbi:hypothetical protein KFU94_17810 [Chloroflexi bacterium TSY]|nr:hypothetical protein [Chloroflexi bacterium TSY]